MSDREYDRMAGYTKYCLAKLGQMGAGLLLHSHFLGVMQPMFTEDRPLAELLDARRELNEEIERKTSEALVLGR